MSSVTDIITVVQAQGSSDGIRGRIQSPVGGDRVYGEVFEVEGWATVDNRPVRGVEALIGGAVVQHADIGLAHDLPGREGGADRQLGGFVLALEAPHEPDYELHLNVVDADESRYPLGTIHARHRMRAQPADAPLVAVVIPCHNQARFIAEAITSVRAQTYHNFEVVVVDDGSADGSADIVQRLGVRCVRQQRQGPSAARNAGFGATCGEYVVFLDGDNRLHPHALEANLHAFEDHSESAFVGGRYSYIDDAGLSLRGKLPDPAERADHYAALLAENYFGSPDNVMFRRSVLDRVGLFDSSVDGLEDYDLYLRIAQGWPVHYHGTAISQYRVHATQFSHDRAMMLRSAVRVLHRHRRRVRSDPALRNAYKQGLAHWRGAFGRSLGNQLRTALRQQEWSEAVKLVSCLLRWHPAGLLEMARTVVSR
jgi:glycosyltransferase involved in cell wall biosynthesis